MEHTERTQETRRSAQNGRRKEIPLKLFITPKSALNPLTTDMKGLSFKRSPAEFSAPCTHPTKKAQLRSWANGFKFNGRDRDRTDDLYRVKVALIPTELRAR